MPYMERSVCGICLPESSQRKDRDGHFILNNGIIIRARNSVERKGDCVACCSHGHLSELKGVWLVWSMKMACIYIDVLLISKPHGWGI